jgi:hypothetical protein
VRRFCRQNPDSGEAARLGVAGFVDDPHPALTEFVVDLIVQKALAGQRKFSTRRMSLS